MSPCAAQRRGAQRSRSWLSRIALKLPRMRAQMSPVGQPRTAPLRHLSLLRLVQRHLTKLLRTTTQTWMMKVKCTLKFHMTML